MSPLPRFLRDYARRYLRYYALGLGFLVLTNVLTVAVPGFVQRAVDALEKGGGHDESVPWAWAILITGVGIMVVRTLSRTLFFNPGRAVEFRMKNGMFDRLLQLPQVFYDRMRPGEIISRGTNDAGSVRALIGFGSLQLFNVCLTLALTLGKMLWENARLTLYCVLPLLVAAVILRYAIRHMFRLTARLQAQLATLSDRILESYNGVAVFQAFNATAGAHARFDDANETLLRIGLALARIRSWLLPVVSVVGNICIVILLYAGAGMVERGELTVGGIAAFAVYVNILVVGLTSLGWLVNAIQRGWIALGRVYDVLDAPSDRPEARASLPDEPGRARTLRVSGLSFSYLTDPACPAEGGAAIEDAPSHSRPVLRDVSFELRAGETLGVFGMTGSGKSTLLDLLARIYEPPPGTIFLDGVDVRELPVADYWRTVTYVPQSAFLFSRTIRENIAVADEAGEVDGARLDRAVADAALADDLDTLAKGLDTRVGERGITLSGGQRQRAALARAFYRPQPGVFLLDDVLSAVDHATERRLIDAIYARGRSTTTVLVSHRVSAVAHAQRIIVLAEGRIVAQGTHDDLIARGDNPYAWAWALQKRDESRDGEGRDG